MNSLARCKTQTGHVKKALLKLLFRAELYLRVHIIIWLQNTKYPIAAINGNWIQKFKTDELLGIFAFY